jgi:hypothetical protein
MASSWRPEGFKNPYAEDALSSHPTEYSFHLYCGYEQGASALLDALRNQGLSWATNSGGLQDFIKRNRKAGRLVFIPDDNPEKS